MMMWHVQKQEIFPADSLQENVTRTKLIVQEPYSQPVVTMELLRTLKSYLLFFWE